MRELCRTLNRHQRTVQRWLDGATVIPPWTIAVLKLARLEHQLIRDQMGFTALEREAQSPPAIPLRHRMPAANEAIHEPRARHQLPLPGFPH